MIYGLEKAHGRWKILILNLYAESINSGILDQSFMLGLDKIHQIYGGDCIWSMIHLCSNKFRKYIDHSDMCKNTESQKFVCQQHHFMLSVYTYYLQLCIRADKLFDVETNIFKGGTFKIY